MSDGGDKTSLHASVSSASSASGDENEDRGNWSGKLDFLLSCIGYAVGLGNIWRFPYLCYRNGGATFLIPYILFMCLCGLPLFFLEVSYGQFASLSPITVWRISPLFKGIGYGMVMISGVVCVYYNIIITWTFYYLFMSFTDVLPWSTCDNHWNTDLAVENINSTNATIACLPPTFKIDNETGGLKDMEWVNTTGINLTALPKCISASEEYWTNQVLDITKGIEDIGTVRWELLLCLLLAWVVIFLCLCKGVKSSGKVVYVTATFPYIVLVILLIRGVTLPGAGKGIRYYLIPQWEKLLEFRVWGEAASQIFYSVGAAWGALITMASYNKFKNNCYRDAVIVPIINCSTSIFAGFVIFSILGFMSEETGQSIDKVVGQGPGLIFVVYPAAIARLPIAPLWAILFFLMIFTLGLDSQFGMFETLTSAFIDEFPQVLRKRKIYFIAGLCFIEFLLGISMVTQGGIYVLQIVDWYSATFSLMVLSICECLVISWIYGVDHFYRDIQLMIGYRPHLIWKYMWKYVTPIIVTFILLFMMATHTPVTYGDDPNKYYYPSWAIGLGWICALCSLVPLPVVAVYQLLVNYTVGTWRQRIRTAVTSSPSWGPALDRYREEWMAMLSAERRKYYRASIVLPDDFADFKGTPDDNRNEPLLEGGKV